jgi:hypothetical protein
MLSGNPTLEPGNYVVAGLSTLDDFINTTLLERSRPRGGRCACL